MPIAEILSQGDEVVTGQTVDTNAAWLATQLTELGFRVARHVSVGDRLADIRDLVSVSVTRADFSICTGGLGPTADDLTAAAVAEAFQRPLQLDPFAMDHIERLYARFGRAMPEANRKQAWLPTGAERLDNDWGTAPGFAIEEEKGWLACLPGVPREMRAMWEHRVLPRLIERFELQPGRLVTLRTTGVGESNLQDRIGDFQEPGVVLAYRTMLPENHIKLRFEAEVPSSRIKQVVADIHDRIGSPVFAIEGLGELGGNLATVVGRDLQAVGHTIACAESCTGGRIASMFTGIAGASAWFVEGCVTYSNEAKVRLLGVDSATLDAHGAVSEPVARQMAEGVRIRAGTTYGLSTTGIAGPGGGSADKPVGTVHVALAHPDGTIRAHPSRLTACPNRIHGVGPRACPVVSRPARD